MGADRDMTYASIFLRAAEIVGGKPQLCRLLEVSEEQCDAWTRGHARPTSQALLKVVEVLLAHVEGKPIPKK